MEEQRYAKMLDKIFSDLRLNTVLLGNITKRIMCKETEAVMNHWYMAHSLSREPGSGQEMLDFVMETNRGNKLYL